MTWWMVALLSFAYLFVGMIIGYLVFDDDVEGIILGGFFWPFIFAIFTLCYILMIPYKLAKFTVEGFKKFGSILSKIKWGHRNSEEEEEEE